MGTTLTGTTPQDTYDSLIKVTDNGPLSSTAKYLSDGLGNDSALALSTTSVGIGTATPDQKLNIAGSQTTAYATSSGSEVLPLGGVNMTMQNTGTGGFTSMRFVSLNGSNAIGYLGFTNTTSSIGGAFVFGQRSGGGYAEQVRIDASGNVGIGTSSPAYKFDVRGTGYFATASGTNQLTLGDSTNGTISALATSNNNLIVKANGTNEIARFTTSGLTFNGDTAAANALDDYEEGTWTMGVSFGGGSTGVTYSINTGSYTKIGRKVTVTGYVVLTSKGTDTGVARITGLPFTIAGATGNFSAPTLYLQNITFANAFQGFGVNGATTIAIYEVTEAGSVSTISNNDFSNTSEIILSFTYFV